VTILSGYLKRRRENPGSFGSEPPVEQDLVSQVEVITGFNWVTHWQAVHGSMMDFVKSKPDVFSIVRMKYIVLKGCEADVPPETQQQVQSPTYVADQQPQQYGQSDPFATLNSLNQPQQPIMVQQPLQQQQYMQQQQPYASSTNPFNSVMNPQAPIAPSYNNPFSLPPDASSYTQYQPAPVQQYTSGGDDGWELFGDSTEASAPIGNSFGADGASQLWGGVPSTDFESQDSNPLAAFESQSDDGARKEAERKAKKAEKKEIKKKLRQESEDEMLARKLQEEEDAAYARARNVSASALGSESSNGVQSSGPALTERVSLTHPEVRELAEKEVGKDNIRILAGFSVIKFGREGRPHQRKMWINSALTHLAWESAQFDGSHRGLELAKVVGVQIGTMTPTIKRSTKDQKKVRTLCFSLETNDRTLDLQACSVIQRDALAAALKKVVEFNHRHKPRRVDKFRTEVLM